MFCCHPVFFNGTLLPCGKCVNCRRRRINDWTIKVLLENRHYNNNSLFCTLTYDNENLPEGSLLDYSDFQKFMKRLRKKISDVRYFCCEEYGSKFGRPHFHCILFNLSYTLENVELVDKCWSKGFTKILPMKPQNARYISKYCVKQFQKVKKFEINGKVIEKREKIHWSSGSVGGLGWRYYFSHISDYFFVNKIKFGGYSYSIPRSFHQKYNKINLLKKVYNCFFSEKKVVNVLSNDSRFFHICQILNWLKDFRFSEVPECSDYNYQWNYLTNSAIRHVFPNINFNSISYLENFFAMLFNFLIDLCYRYDSDTVNFKKTKTLGCNVYIDSFNYVLSHFSFQFFSFSDFQHVLDVNRRRSIDYCCQHHIDFFDYEKKYFYNDISYYNQLLVDNNYVIF